MKKLLIAVLAVVMTFMLASSVFAAEKAKEVTITGEGMCAKCALHLQDHCQTVIQVKKDGKTLTYWLAPNKTAKDFHDNICKENHKVTATGTVKKEDGKLMLLASKVELAK